MALRSLMCTVLLLLGSCASEPSEFCSALLSPDKNATRILTFEGDLGSTGSVFFISDPSGCGGAFVTGADDVLTSKLKSQIGKRVLITGRLEKDGQIVSQLRLTDVQPLPDA